MQIQITTANKTQDYFFFEATCGKKSASVYISDTFINVICKNASHRAWRGVGKTFQTEEEAMEGYKSSEMKAIIQAAFEMSMEAA
jgi:DNA-binding protein H-NS